MEIFHVGTYVCCFATFFFIDEQEITKFSNLLIIFQKVKIACRIRPFDFCVGGRRMVFNNVSVINREN